MSQRGGQPSLEVPFVATRDRPTTDVETQWFRLRPIMRQGTASSVPETWTKYRSIEEARAGARQMYRDDRVLRVMLALDGAGTFVEWIER